MACRADFGQDFNLSKSTPLKFSTYETTVATRNGGDRRVSISEAFLHRRKKKKGAVGTEFPLGTTLAGEGRPGKQRAQNKSQTNKQLHEKR